MVNETDLNSLNNEQMVQYIKKLQETLEQYKTREVTLFMAPRIRKEASFETPKTRTKEIHTQSKGKAKVEDEKSSDETPRDINWKLARAVQR